VAFKSGTSQASPHAVGVGALLKQARPGLTSDQIEWMLKATGKWVKDEFNDSDPNTLRWTPRVDARVALVTDFTADFDRDGCSNQEELGLNVALGGLRNPLDVWDFFDTPTASNVRDKIILSSDTSRVQARFGSDGDPTIDPLSPPPPAPAYHPAFDRGGTVGPNAWNLAPANGSIRIPDITAVVNSFGHDCRAAP
jgi:subtilisin family serine protease